MSINNKVRVTPENYDEVKHYIINNGTVKTMNKYGLSSLECAALNRSGNYQEYNYRKREISAQYKKSYNDTHKPYKEPNNSQLKLFNGPGAGFHSQAGDKPKTSVDLNTVKSKYFTTEQVVTMCSMAKNGCPQKDIAKAIGYGSWCPVYNRMNDDPEVKQVFYVYHELGKEAREAKGAAKRSAGVKRHYSQPVQGQDARAKQSAAAKKAWERLTDEQKRERVERLKAARLAKKKSVGSGVTGTNRNGDSGYAAKRQEESGTLQRSASRPEQSFATNTDAIHRDIGQNRPMEEETVQKTPDIQIVPKKETVSYKLALGDNGNHPELDEKSVHIVFFKSIVERTRAATIRGLALFISAVLFVAKAIGMADIPWVSWASPLFFYLGTEIGRMLFLGLVVAVSAKTTPLSVGFKIKSNNKKK